MLARVRRRAPAWEMSLVNGCPLVIGPQVHVLAPVRGPAGQPLSPPVCSTPQRVSYDVCVCDGISRTGCLGNNPYFLPNSFAFFWKKKVFFWNFAENGLWRRSGGILCISASHGGSEMNSSAQLGEKYQCGLEIAIILRAVPALGLRAWPRFAQQIV